LKKEVAKRSEKSEQIQKEKIFLQENIARLNSRIKGKGALQGDKHVLWDSLAADITKFRQYLNFFDDKNTVTVIAGNKCAVVNETLLKIPLDWAQNAINLLNSVSNVDLQTIGFKDRTAIIIWARKIIGKHNHIKNVQTKAKQME